MPPFLARRRRQLELTVEQVADACGMTPHQLRAIEGGSWLPAPHQAPALATVLQLPLEAVTGWVIGGLLTHPDILRAQVGAA